MKETILTTDQTVLLVGGGAIDRDRFKSDLDRGLPTIAADGGADAVLKHDHIPDFVIGDLDSLSKTARSRIPSDRIHLVAEQDSTDFDKVLRHVHAPCFEAHGFMGLRMDHSLAALNTLVRYPHKRCVLHAENDLIVLCPSKLRLELPKSCRVSLFPMRPVKGQTSGLKWPINGLDFAPWGQSGTSNMALGAVDLAFETAGMLLILPVDQIDELRRGLANAPTWPAP